jgi:xanthine dehydrogenase accessory factor
MKEFLKQLEKWQQENKHVAMARVIQTWGSSPRPIGSIMLISSDLEMAGSVSGGCVEGAVVKEAKNVFSSENGKRLDYGVSDDDAWAVGLSCGGKIQVYIQPLQQNEVFKELQKKLTDNEGCILVTSIVDGATRNSLINDKGGLTGDSISPTLLEKVKQAYSTRTHQAFTENDIEYFIQVFPPRSKMLIIGAAHITADLIQLGKMFDFETIVIDPRGTFARNTTFPVAPDQLHEKYPSEVLEDFTLDPYTYAVILSHDPKIDDDALKVLLRSHVAYVGALGSKKNHQKRISRLTASGFSEEEINKINAPIGLDIHAIGAKEIAFSIMGAIIKSKNEFV